MKAKANVAKIQPPFRRSSVDKRWEKKICAFENHPAYDTEIRSVRLCHLVASPEFMGLSQHPSATNIQEVT